jgi:beta-lactam-binding protein with PASTA domain
VPAVEGLPEADARSRLVDAGFEVLVIRERALGGSRVGAVGSQSPPADASVPRGSLVILYAGV